MADNFTVVQQYPGVQAIGGTAVRDVVFVGIETRPHGTYLEFPLDAKVYRAALVHSEATGWATILETLWDEPNVAGVQWTQQVNASNLLVNVLIVTVSSTSGNSTALLELPYSRLAPELYRPGITALHKELDAAEAQ